MSNNPTIVFTNPKLVEIQDLQIPAPAKDQLLIETQYTLISTGTELTILDGNFAEGSGWERFQFPFYPGYNNIGKVVDVGESADREWIGKKVATHGPHAKYFVSDAHNARLFHKDIPDDHATFFTLAEIVMNGIRRGRVEFGESVIVYGLGLLGQLAVRFSKMCGAHRVFAADISDNRLRMLPDDASIIPVNLKRSNIVDIVQRETRNRMADVVFEVTGSAELIPDEFKALRRQGRFVVLSSPKGKTQFDFHDLCNGPSFTIIGAHNFSHPEHESLQTPWTKKRHAELFFDLLADKTLDVEPLISHRAHFSEAESLYQMLLKDRTEAMGVVLKWF